MRIEKENYVAPEMEIVEFENEDVIIASNTTPNDVITGFTDGLDL